MKSFRHLKLNSIGLILNVERPEAQKVGREILLQAKKLGVNVLIEKRSAQLLRRSGQSLAVVACKVDGLVIAGGDGTLLSTVPEAAAADCPILGINLGSLGFLTPIPRSETALALKHFVEGRWKPYSRSILQVTVQSFKKRRSRKVGLALNDAVVSRSRGALLVRFSVWVNTELMTHFSADGLIVATPTGSTAYSLGANGAVLVPDAPVLILTPICPHTLTNRPVIISDQSTVRIRPAPGEKLLLTLDGHREHLIQDEMEVEISLAPMRLTLATMPRYSFFEVLRNKLRWSGSNTSI